MDSVTLSSDSCGVIAVNAGSCLSSLALRAVRKSMPHYSGLCQRQRVTARRTTCRHMPQTDLHFFGHIEAATATEPGFEQTLGVCLQAGCGAHLLRRTRDLVGVTVDVSDLVVRLRRRELAFTPTLGNVKEYN